MTLLTLLNAYNRTTDDLYVAVYDVETEYEYQQKKVDIPELLLNKKVETFDIVGVLDNILTVIVK